MGVRERRRKRQRLLAVEIDFPDQQRRRVWETVALLPLSVDRSGKETVNQRDLKRAHELAVETLAERKLQVKRGTFTHPRDAKAAAEAEAQRAREAAENVMTFRKFAARFLKDYASQKRSDFYEGRVKTLCERWGNLLLAAITPADIDAFTSDRLRAGRKPSTVRRDLAVVAVMFRMARRWGLIEHSPAADLMRPKEPTHKTRFLSADEWTRLDAEAAPWLRPLLRFAVLTGLRLKEVVGARWADYDKTAGTLALSGDNKTLDVRTVPLSADALAVVEAQRRAQGRELRPLGPFIFTDAEGHPYTAEGQRGRITKATIATMRRAGIAGAGFHTLRHTFGTWAAQRKVPLFEIQRAMGHSTPLMTQRYVNLVPEDLRGAVESVAAAFRASGDTVLIPDPARGVEAVSEPVTDGPAKACGLES